MKYNAFKIVSLMIAFNFSPLHAEDKKEEPASWTKTKIAAGVLVGFSGLATLMCRLHFGSFQHCFRNMSNRFQASLPLGPLAAIGNMQIGDNPVNGPGGQDVGEGNPSEKSALELGVLATSLGRTKVIKFDEKTETVESQKELRERLANFMRQAYRGMDSETQDPGRFCLRRARIIREQWNRSRSQNMGAIYALQHESSNQMHTINNQWSYHVAALYLIPGSNGLTGSLVLDPLFDEVLSVQEWMRRLGITKKHKVVIAQPNEDYNVGFAKKPFGISPTTLVRK